MIFRLSKKQMNIVKYTQIVLIVFVVAIVIFTFTVVRKANNFSGTYQNSFYTVSKSDVSVDVGSNDIAVVKRVEIEDITIYDKVAFISRKPLTFGEVVVAEVQFSDYIDGDYYFSVSNSESDFRELVNEEDVLGVYQYRLIGLGWLLLLTNNFINYFFILLLPFLLALFLTIFKLNNDMQIEKGMEYNAKEDEVNCDKEPFYEPIIDDEDFEDSVSLQHFMEGLSNYDYSITNFKTNYSFRPQVIIKDNKIIRFWSNASVKNDTDIIILGEKYLISVLFNAMIFLYESKKDVFERRLQDVLAKNDSIENCKSSFLEIFLDIKEGNFKKYFDIILSFYQIIVISKTQFILSVLDEIDVTEDLEKKLKFKKYLNNDLKMPNYVNEIVKYRIFYD